LACKVAEEVSAVLNAISGAASVYPIYHSRTAGAVRNAQEAPRTAVLPAAQPETPVQPVGRVNPVPEVGLDNEALLRRFENDPVALSVRGRIQYPEEEGSKAPAGLAPEEETEKAEDAEEALSPREVLEEAECQTCKNRKYKDRSDDLGVSFKTPRSVDPSQASAAVRGHEYEHVTRERAKAEREDRRVVNQSVVYHTAICPECGRVYTSGGETRTVTAANPQPEEPKEPENARDNAVSSAAPAMD